MEAKMEKIAENLAQNSKIEILIFQIDGEFKIFLVKVSMETNSMVSELHGGIGSSPSGPETDEAILVLNTKPFAAKPLIFDLNGKFFS